MLTVADRGEGGKICQNRADVICERFLKGRSNTGCPKKSGALLKTLSFVTATASK